MELFRKFRGHLFLIAAVMGIYCVLLPSAIAQNQLNVYVVNYPLKYFAETIGGPHVKVTLPIPSDVDPAYWTPSVSDIGAYQKADLILLNGAGYARWVNKVSLPRSKTVNTSRAFKDRYIIAKEITTHSHGAAGEHAHEALAFTTWLDLSLAEQQAQAIYQAFLRNLPELKSYLLGNYTTLKNNLLALDHQFKTVIAENPSMPLLFSHPVYDYLIGRYALNGRSLHWEPDQVPTADQMNELQHIRAEHPAQWFVWEGKPLDLSVEKLQAAGISSTVFDPCGNRPASGDFMSAMRQNIINMEYVFKDQN
jgi:zinc transport system substrate-binding protein